ncbi:hypothetical protein Mame01_61030 [Microbispora amethystogenes]|nr:hypothetical protein Mame01_61030 [Microbispora amethystogenes]
MQPPPAGRFATPVSASRNLTVGRESGTAHDTARAAVAGGVIPLLAAAATASRAPASVDLPVRETPAPAVALVAVGSVDRQGSRTRGPFHKDAAPNASWPKHRPGPVGVPAPVEPGAHTLSRARDSAVNSGRGRASRRPPACA